MAKQQNLEDALRRTVAGMVREYLDEMTNRPGVKRCSATTQAGGQCARDALPGETVCRVHLRMAERASD